MTISTLRAGMRRLRFESLRLLFDYKERQALDPSAVKSILIDQRRDLIGDMVVCTLAIRELKKYFPDLAVHVLAGPVNREVLRYNPHVTRIWEYRSALRTVRDLRSLGLGVFYFHGSRLRWPDFVLLRYLGARVNIARLPRAMRLVDVALDANARTEVDRYRDLLAAFGIREFEARYDVFVDERELTAARDFMARIPGRPRVVFNQFGNPRGKTFSLPVARALVEAVLQVAPGAGVVLLAPPGHIADAKTLCRQFSDGNVVVSPGIRTIRDSAALIRHCDLVITPDTSIVHVACAMDTPQLCVYRNAEELALWPPVSPKARALLPPEHDVNSVTVEEFRVAVRELLEQFVPGSRVR